MKNTIYLILFLAANVSYGQKSYSFNFYTSYDYADNNANKSILLTFSDTIKNKHRLTINIKNDTITSANLTDFEVFYSYTFDMKNKKIENLDFNTDFSSSFKKSFRSENFDISEICARYKFYDRDLKKVNDSIAIESFKFYKKRNKKELAYNVTIEILTDKKINNLVPSDFINIISDCIDDTYSTKIINKINTIHFRDDGSKTEEQLQLIKTNTTNFSINIQ